MPLARMTCPKYVNLSLVTIASRGNGLAPCSGTRYFTILQYCIFTRTGFKKTECADALRTCRWVRRVSQWITKVWNARRVSTMPATCRQAPFTVMQNVTGEVIHSVYECAAIGQARRRFFHRWLCSVVVINGGETSSSLTELLQKSIQLCRGDFITSEPCKSLLL